MKPGLRPTLLATAVFVCAIAILFGEVWLQDPRTTVPATSRDGVSVSPNMKTDTTYVAWVIGRNAAAWLRSPHRIFQAEHCFPADNALTLSEPLLSMGLLGAPFRFLTHDPILTYNIALLLLPLLGALGMFLLISEWTGSPGAAIAAGLLYAFHEVQLGDISHPFQRDLSWMIFVLFFARRFFADGRWRDALGLAACGALQLGNSLYPVLSATFLIVALVPWLWITYGLGQLRWKPVAMILVTTLGAAVFVFAPYLEVQAASGGMTRNEHYYSELAAFLPGRKLFPGWVLLSLACAGIALPPRRSARPGIGDPRGVLVLGGVLAAWVASGPVATLIPGDPPVRLPNLYGAIAEFIPGLRSVRAVGTISAGAHWSLCILAGLGAAGLLRGLPSVQARRFAGAGLVLWVGVATLGPDWIGGTPPYRFAPLAIRPDASTLAFFEELERRGNSGPILEVPTYASVDRGPVQLGSLAFSPERVLLTSFHGRRTSACLGSYSPPERLVVGKAADRLPDPEALRDLARMGFTTLVVRHQGKPNAPVPLRRALEGLSKKGDLLRLVYATPELRAYAIAP